MLSLMVFENQFCNSNLGMKSCAPDKAIEWVAMANTCKAFDQMEIGIKVPGVFVGIILAIAIASLYLSFVWREKKIHGIFRPLPPGRLGLPFIGETLQFYRAQRSNRLFEDFIGERIERHGHVFKTGLIGHPTVVINGAAGNRFLMSNEFKLVVSSWPTATIKLMGSGSIMEKSGHEHRRLRGAVMACLRADVLQAFVGKMNSVIERHFDRHWKGNDVVHVFPSTKLLTFSSVCSLFLGLEDENDKGRFLELFETVLQGVLSIPIDIPGTRFRRAKAARCAIDKFLLSLVEKRRRDLEEGKACPNQDLFSRLLSLRDEDQGKRLSDMEVIDNIVLLVFAAHDTSSLVMTMMCKMLSQHKHCYEEMLREHQEILSSKKSGEELTWEDTRKMKYTWRVAQETMRLIPPIFGSFRKTIVDIEFEGYTIPKGWKVLWTAYSTHYSGECFPEPEKFKPSRFEDAIPPYVFVPFGGGPRLCAGYELAKMQILLFMHHLITRYQWCLVDPDEEIIMDPLPAPERGLPITLKEKIN